MREPPGVGCCFPTGLSGLDTVDLASTPRGPFPVLPLRLAIGARKDEWLPIRREAGVSDAFLGIQRMHEAAVGGGKQGGVPGALRLASGHDGMPARGVPGTGFHEAGPVLPLLDL